MSDLETDCKKMSEAVAAAKNILIVGGGPVGVELAGEIVDQHKDKNITIVTKSEKLVTPDFDEKFQNSIKSLIEQNNVKVIHKYILQLVLLTPFPFKIKIGQVKNLESLEKNLNIQQTVQVDEEEIEADLVISCIGKLSFKVNTIYRVVNVPRSPS